MARPNATGSQGVLECAGSHYILSGKDDYVLEFYRGNNRLNGYFVINENREMHQGVYYTLNLFRQRKFYFASKGCLARTSTKSATTAPKWAQPPTAVLVFLCLLTISASECFRLKKRLRRLKPSDMPRRH